MPQNPTPAIPDTGELTRLTGPGNYGLAQSPSERIAALFHPTAVVDKGGLAGLVHAGAGDNMDVFVAAKDGIIVVSTSVGYSPDDSAHEGLVEKLELNAKGDYKLGADTGPLLMTAEDRRSDDYSHWAVDTEQVVRFAKANPNAIVVEATLSGSTPVTLGIIGPVQGARAMGEALAEGHVLYVPGRSAQLSFANMTRAGLPLDKAFEIQRPNIANNLEVLGLAMTGWGKSLETTTFDAKTGATLGSHSTGGYFSAKDERAEIALTSSRALASGARTVENVERTQNAAAVAKEAARVATAVAFEVQFRGASPEQALERVKAADAQAAKSAEKDAGRGR